MGLVISEPDEVVQRLREVNRIAGNAAGADDTVVL